MTSAAPKANLAARCTKFFIFSPHLEPCLSVGVPSRHNDHVARQKLRILTFSGEGLFIVEWQSRLRAIYLAEHIDRATLRERSEPSSLSYQFEASCSSSQKVHTLFGYIPD